MLVVNIVVVVVIQWYAQSDCPASHSFSLFLLCVNWRHRRAVKKTGSSFSRGRKKSSCDKLISRQAGTKSDEDKWILVARKTLTQHQHWATIVSQKKCSDTHKPTHTNHTQKRNERRKRHFIILFAFHLALRICDAWMCEIRDSQNTIKWIRFECGSRKADCTHHKYSIHIP